MKTLQILCLLSLVACSHEAPPTVPPRAVLVQTVSVQGAANATLYSGEVRARQEGDLAFRVGGKVVSREVNLGQTVKRGQLLARLDGQDFNLAAQAAAQQVKAAEADLGLARVELERAEKLLAQRFVSASAVDTRRTQVQAAEARLKQAQDQAGVAKNQQSYGSLVADRDGVVTALNVEVGQVVGAGQSVLRLANPASREALIWVPEARLAGLKIGDAALVRPSSMPNVLVAGRLREIAGAADATTRTYAVRVSIAEGAEQFPLGSTVGVGFIEPAAKDKIAAVSVPLPAVVRNTQIPQVWVVGADNRVSLRTVKVASFNDNEAVIAEGLQSGERVVVSGALSVSAGELVRPVAQAAPVQLDIQRQLPGVK